MKKLLTSVMLVCLLQDCLAQQDSLAFVQAKWTVKKIAAGIQLRQCWFDHSLFGSSQNISILEIKMKRKNRLDVEAEPRQLQPTSKFGTAHDALAAINGNFFDMKNGGSVDYLRIDGKTLHEARLGKDNTRAMHQRAAVVIDGNKISIRKWNGIADWETTLAGEDVMETGPLLLEDGKRIPLDTTSFYTMRHPRSAVAIKGNKVFLITADGRNKKAAGMTLAELTNIIQWLHAADGINLDGGGSTTLWINHFPEGGVINYPSDNKQMQKSAAYKPGMDLDNLAADEQKWDHTGERPVANVLLVNKKK